MDEFIHFFGGQLKKSLPTSIILGMSKVIAIANQKGGVGKTTTSINLSSALSHLQKKVLLIDLDPQGNSGRGVGIDITTVKKTIYEVLDGHLNIKDCVIKTTFDGLCVVPGNLRLAGLEASLYTNVVKEPFALLKNALASIRDDYDYIILDCPPSLGLLSINAMVASDSVLVPVQCEYFAMEGVASVLSSISNVQNGLNPNLKIEGFLLTMYDSKTVLGTEIAAEVRRLFRESTFLTSIPRNQSIQESQARQMPVTAFRPTSSGSAAYFALAREIIDHEER